MKATAKKGGSPHQEAIESLQWQQPAHNKRRLLKKATEKISFNNLLFFLLFFALVL